MFKKPRPVGGELHFTSTIRYVPTPESGENFSLTIAGAGEKTTILDCGSNAQALLIDTTALSDGSQAEITLDAFWISGAGNIDMSTNANIVWGSVLFAAGSINVDIGSAGGDPSGPIIGPIDGPINLVAAVGVSTAA